MHCVDIVDNEGGGNARRKATERQEREAVRGPEGEGHVEGAGGQDRQLPGASKHGGKKSGSGGNAEQGGTTAQHKAAGRKGGKAGRPVALSYCLRRRLM